jgi:transcriptional regulator with XRE-family HTH domain
MSTRERASDRGLLKGRTIVAEIGQEIRRARLDHGLSQADVARAARTSKTQVSRVELGLAPRVSVLELARLLAVVGMELCARAYPAGQPIRDAAHLKLMARFRARLAPTIVWRAEVPIGGVGDLRAWDAVVVIGPTRIAVEAETRPRDLQALLRRIALKRRDDPGIHSVVLLLAATRHNRDLVREYGPALLVDFAVAGEEMLAALAGGRAPAGSAVVMV